ncbi:MAG: DUF308 domain-containing protein [Patescibacteria group bacterium]|nr:DUF308 domain-containing protein [Actinomycetota bacterium]MCL5438644.1 DUF308 domain-containing protein [Patescibacteria group bacterium]
MAKNLSKKSSDWWIFLLEGVFQLILGLLLLFSTDITVFLLVQLLGVYWLIRGIIMIIRVLIGKERNWGWVMLGGILGIVSGIIVLRYPIFSSFIILEFLVVLIAFVGIIQGTISLVSGFRGGSFGEVLLGAVLWIICLLLLFNPLSSIIALPVVIGILWIVSGAILTTMSFYLRK